MPGMQGFSDVHLVDEGWQVFFVRQTSTILPPDHPFRLDIKNFTKGVIVKDLEPQMMTGPAVRAQLDALEVNKQGGFVGYGKQYA